MVYTGRRVTVIENKTNQQVEIIVTLFPTDRPHKRTSIAPSTSTEVPATGFCYASCNRDRHPKISVYVDGTLSRKFLTSRNFVSYGRIIFGGDPDGHLLISGVKARWTDLGRIKDLGFIFGRSSDGNRSYDSKRGSDMIGKPELFFSC